MMRCRTRRKAGIFRYVGRWKCIRNANELPPSDLISHRREIPFSPDWRHIFERPSTVPETELQALMQSAPHTDPARSLEETAEIRERIVDALEGLEPRMRWIFEARAFRGLSVRQIGTELSLSKSYVDRIFKAAQKKLQDQLIDLVNGEQ